MHGDLQHEPLGVAVRIRDLPRHRVPRLLPGPARLRPAGTRPGPRPHPGAGRHPAGLRRRVPPVPAAHQERQRRHRVGLQRRSALAGARRRRLPEGDRRRGDPGRAGALRRRAGRSVAAVRAPGTVAAVHAGPARPAPAAAHRPGRLERLPEPQLLLGRAGAVVPDHGERDRRDGRVGVHRRAVRARRHGSSPRSPSGAEQAADAAGLPGRGGEDGRRGRRARLGRRSGSAAPTTIPATPSARRRTPRGRSSSSRRACA